METEAVAACPVCGDGRRELLHSQLVDRLYGAPGRWRFQRCGGCGSAYLDPRPTAESIAAAYESYYTHDPVADGGPASGRLRLVRRALRNDYLNARYDYALAPASPLGRLVVPLIPGRRAAADRHVRTLSRPREGARLLDVGCGGGDFLLEMRAAGWTPYGLELDPRAVARARERSLDVRAGTLAGHGYPPRSFDAITLSHVLEHLHEPAAALRACRELVRDDGILWIATPNPASPGHARYGRAWRGLEPPRHLVLFTAPALVRALERAGFGAISFRRPAGAAWVYRASEQISAAGSRSRARLALAIALADVNARIDRRRGEELVVVARPR